MSSGRACGGDLRTNPHAMNRVCVGPVPAAGLSRRAFLDRFGLGLGASPWPTCCAPPIRPPASGLRHPRRPTAASSAANSIIPAKAKRVIYLFMAGGPSQLETFDYKPLLNERNGEELPDSVRLGQRLTGMSGNQAIAAAGRFDLQVCATWPVRRLGQRVAAAHGARSWTTSASSARCTPRPSTTTRRSPSSRPARRSHGRPSIGRVAAVTASAATTQNLPAFVVLITPGQGGPAAVLAAVGQRLPAVRSIRACSSGRARIRCFT